MTDTYSTEYYDPNKPERRQRKGRPLNPLTDFSGHLNATDPSLRQKTARALSGGSQTAENVIEGGLTFDPLTTAHAGGRALGESRYGDAALDLAGSLPGFGKIAGGALAGVKGAMFIGPMARNWYKPAERHAAEMAANGIDRETILRQTGLFQGKDGMWRKEISDQPARWIGMGSASERPMAKVIEHPELYENYPQLAKLPVERISLPPNIGGGLTFPTPKGLGKMFINPNFRGGSTARERLSTGLHESQHGIQQIEGFAGGASNQLPAHGLPPAHQAQQLVQKHLDRFKDPVFLQNAIQDLNKAGIPQASWDDAMKGWAEQQAMDEWYQRVAGEVESRNVQFRSGWSMPERMQSPPWNSEEFIPSKQFINPDRRIVPPPKLPRESFGRDEPQLPFRPKLPRSRP